MKKYFLFACTAAALVSCSNDDFLGENQNLTQNENGAIMFSSVGQKATRANLVGADAAAALAKHFVVDGSKGEGASAYANKLVFDQYNVNYYENTANTTESNTANWEYAGEVKHTHSSVAAQTIKYWDFTEPLYDFIAYSTGGKTADYTTGTVADGSVQISAIDRTKFGSSTDPVYTVKGKAADLQKFYITDVNTVKKAQYGETVTLQFRALAAKVRIAFYETIPGYSVSELKFYPEAKSTTTDFTGSTETGKVYAETAVYGQTGTASVYYPIVGTNNESVAAYNEAVVKITDTSDGSKDLELGTVHYNAKKELAEDGNTTADNDYDYIGRHANQASFVGNSDDNYYTPVLPAYDGTVMNLRVDYTLTSTDGSGEKIYVKGATAQVPAVYTSWLPNYAYTYIFKISNNTNGWTGTSTDGTDEKAGLYPITFDAVVVNAEDADLQETITTVSTKSITTAQWDATNKKFVANQNEYTASNEIYVMVHDGGTLATGNTAAANNVALYVVTKESGCKITSEPTEADVVDALKYQTSVTAGVIIGRNLLKLAPATSPNALSVTNGTKTFYNEDGTTYTPASGAAAYFTPAGATKYAFVYNNVAQGSATDMYEAIVQPTAGSSVKGYYKYATEAATGTYVAGTTYYTDAACTTKVNTSSFVVGYTDVTSYYVINKAAAKVACANDEVAKNGVTYFVKYANYASAQYSVKYIKVQ